MLWERRPAAIKPCLAFFFRYTQRTRSLRGQLAAAPCRRDFPASTGPADTAGLDASAIWFHSKDASLTAPTAMLGGKSFCLGSRRMQFLEHKILLVMVALASFPLYRHIGKAFFGERYQSFTEALRYICQSDAESFRRRELLEDRFATIKLAVWVLLCLGWSAAVTEFLARHVV
jgi:hypothetical protein